MVFVYFCVKLHTTTSSVFPDRVQTYVANSKRYETRMTGFLWRRQTKLQTFYVELRLPHTNTSEAKNTKQ